MDPDRELSETIGTAVAWILLLAIAFIVITLVVKFYVWILSILF